MAEPNVIKYTIPSAVQKLFRIFEQDEKKKEKAVAAEGSKIEIGDTLSKMAFFYEKIRNAIDYQEEHLLRKNAVLRILKRRFVSGIDTNLIAEPLIKELIQGGYLPNNHLPESKIQEVTVIINKYAALINQIYHIHNRSDRRQIFKWLISLCACEIEENLGYNITNHALIDFMYHLMDKRIVIRGSKIKPEVRNIQIYISILRTLMRYDTDMLSYHIFLYYFPEWFHLNHSSLEKIALHIYKIKFKVKLQLENPLGERLNRIMRKYMAIFTIFKDLVKKDPSTAVHLVQDIEELQTAVKKACNNKYQEIKAKLKRTSVRSIIYIFLTKMLIALILEIPYELYIEQSQLNFLPLGINIAFHPLLLFIIALVIRVPSEENTRKIFTGIKNIVYDYPEKNVQHYIKPPAKRGWFVTWLFRFFYLLTYVVTFGTIIFALYTLHFNIISIMLFLLFLSLVTFFGLKVRQGANELLVMDERPGMISAFLTFLLIPIIRAGRWISVKFSKINVFVFFFDIFIEAPFKLLIDVFEDWSTYIKEKREEIYDKE